LGPIHPVLLSLKQKNKNKKKKEKEKWNIPHLFSFKERKRKY
jgi:hypothetical protein